MRSVQEEVQSPSGANPEAAAGVARIESDVKELRAELQHLQELQAEMQSKEAAETESLGEDDALHRYDPEVNPALILDLTQDSGKAEATAPATEEEEEPRVTSPTTRAERLVARANKMDMRSAGAGGVQAQQRVQAATALSTMRDDLVASKAKWQEAAVSISKLEADVKEQLAEVQSVQAAVADAEGRIHGLQEQVHSLQASKSEADVARASADLSSLREEVSHSQTEVNASIKGLQEELSGLAAKLTSSQSVPTAETEARRSSIAKMVQTLKEDEAVESEAYTRLLAHIGDLCSKLEVVDAAVSAATHAAEGNHTNGSAVDKDGSSAAVATADVYQRLSTLAGRVEASENQATQILAMLRQHLSSPEASQ